MDSGAPHADTCSNRTPPLVAPRTDHVYVELRPLNTLRSWSSGVVTLPEYGLVDMPMARTATGRLGSHDASRDDVVELSMKLEPRVSSSCRRALPERLTRLIDKL